MEELLAALHPKQSHFTYTHYMTPECLQRHLQSKDLSNLRRKTKI